MAVELSELILVGTVVDLNAEQDSEWDVITKVFLKVEETLKVLQSLGPYSLLKLGEVN